jgi:hypothetical protein
MAHKNCSDPENEKKYVKSIKLAQSTGSKIKVNKFMPQMC